jgi:hypothetical protein
MMLVLFNSRVAGFHADTIKTKFDFRFLLDDGSFFDLLFLGRPGFFQVDVESGGGRDDR